jgi:hypothetical protein
MRANIGILSLTILTAMPLLAEVEGPKLEYHGAGWLQSGRVEKSYTPGNSGNNYNKNWIGQSGGLLSLHAGLDEKWDGSLGIGTVLVHLARGSVGVSNKWYPFWVSFVDEARVSRTSTLFTSDDQLKLTFGNFHYGYNPDVKNLGGYLLHGYVYPGAIETGFTGPLGVDQAISGAQVSYKIGGIKNDLNFQIETDAKPLYDVSVSDIVAWRLHPAFEIGAGVNFYRVLPANKKATVPDADCDASKLGLYAGTAIDNPCYIVTAKDSSNNVIAKEYASLQGTKLMGRFHLDPKALFSSEGETVGKDAFVLYGEVAVLGTKNYPVFYDKLLRRMPAMFGLNLPGFNFLNWSVEAEYYASKISSNNLAAKSGSPIPTLSDVDPKRDDWKWSFNASKVVAGHVALLGQLANDHLRLGGNHDEDSGQEALRTMSDWYWTTKIAYFF